LTLDPRPPALRGERRYLVKQRKLAVYRRVCAVQLFNEDLDHLDAPLCFCLLSRALSPPCIRHAGPRSSSLRLSYYTTERESLSELLTR